MEVERNLFLFLRLPIYFKLGGYWSSDKHVRLLWSRQVGVRTLQGGVAMAGWSALLASSWQVGSSKSSLLQSLILGWQVLNRNLCPRFTQVVWNWVPALLELIGRCDNTTMSYKSNLAAVNWYESAPIINENPYLYLLEFKQSKLSTRCENSLTDGASTHWT